MMSVPASGTCSGGSNAFSEATTSGQDIPGLAAPRATISSLSNGMDLGERNGEQEVTDGKKLQGWDFMLGDSAKKKRKPLKGRRRGRAKKIEQNRVNERKARIHS